MKIRIPGVRKLRERTERGNPLWAATQEPRLAIITNNLLKALSRHSKWDDNKAWTSQEWKADKSMDDGTGQPVVTSWRKTYEYQSSFFHEKTQTDGTGLSVVNEENPRDRPVVIPPREMRPQQFIIWKR